MKSFTNHGRALHLQNQKYLGDHDAHIVGVVKSVAQGLSFKILFNFFFFY